MLKKLGVILAGLLLMLTTAACHKAPQADDSEININVPSDVTGTLRVGTEDNDGSLNIMNMFVREFKKDFPNVNVEIVPLAGSYVDAITQSVAAEEGIDVFWIRSSMQLLAAKRILYNFKDAYDAYCAAGKIDESDLYESMIKQGEWNGGLYQIPRDYNKIVIVYNREIFDRYGIKYPTNPDWKWQDFLDLCAKFRAKMGETEYPINGLLMWESVFETVVSGFGGKMIDNGTVKFDSKEAKDGLKELKKLIDLRYSPNPRLQQIEPFLNRKAAMYITSRPAVQDFITAGLDIDFINFPEMPVNAVVGAGTTGHGISRFSQNKDLAFQFIMSTLTTDSQNAYSETGACVPMLKSLAQTGTWRDVPTSGINHDAFISFPERDMVDNYRVGINPELHVDIEGYILSLLYDIYDGKNIDEVCANYKQKIESAIKNF